MAEKRNSFSSYFVTLTYDEKHLPRTDTGCSINKDDHKKFINELKELESEERLSERQKISQEENDRKQRLVPEIGKLKYYGVYEYGDQTQRSHAHYILFNVRDINNIIAAWGMGRVEIDPDVNQNNIDYVLKYMVKLHKGENENRQKEVSYCSKGIGTAAADEHFISYLRRDSTTQIVNARNHKIPIPRYYKKKYLSDEERRRKGIFMAKEAIKVQEDRDRYYRRLKVDISKQELKEKEARLQALKSQPKRLFQ